MIWPYYIIIAYIVRSIILSSWIRIKSSQCGKVRIAGIRNSFEIHRHLKIPLFHYSPIPQFLYSTIPQFPYSIIPLFHNSPIPLFPYSPIPLKSCITYIISTFVINSFYFCQNDFVAKSYPPAYVITRVPIRPWKKMMFRAQNQEIFGGSGPPSKSIEIFMRINFTKNFKSIRVSVRKLSCKRADNQSH